MAQTPHYHAFGYHILSTVLKRAILGDLRRAGNSGSWLQCTSKEILYRLDPCTGLHSDTF